jgi:hypothetical protein
LIVCLRIEEEHLDSAERSGHVRNLSMSIRSQIKRGKTQVFGLFNFTIIEGIMRFENPNLPPEEERKESKKRKMGTVLG